MSEVVERLRTLQQRWTRGRRVLAPAGLLAVVAAVAVSALVAGADEPRRKPAADVQHAKPKYLVPIGTLIQDGAVPGPSLTGDQGSVGVPAGTPRPGRPNPATAAQEAPTIATFGGPGGTITPAGLATLALEAGCSPGAAVTATAIAMAESGGSPSAQGDIGLMDGTWDWSAGLWQIRGLRSERNTGGLRDSVANQAVVKNAAAMHEISAGCTDWTPWSTYVNGAYLQFLPLAQQAVTYVVRWFNAHGHHYPPVPAPDPAAPIPAGGGAGAAQAGAAAPAPRTSTAPRRAHSSAPARPRNGATGGAGHPAASSSAGPVPAAGSSVAGGGGVPLPLPTSTAPKLPLPTSSAPKLPLPTSSLPKLPLPTSSLPKLP